MSQSLGEQKHAACWFEIPTVDFGRAIKFYEAVFGYTLHQMDMPGGKCAFFPCDMQGGVGGHLWHGEDPTNPPNKPSATGPQIFLNADGHMDAVIGRIGAAGGKVILPKTSIGQHGYIATFLDSEGNRLSLHSRTA